MRSGANFKSGVLTATAPPSSIMFGGAALELEIAIPQLGGYARDKRRLHERGNVLRVGGLGKHDRMLNLTSAEWRSQPLPPFLNSQETRGIAERGRPIHTALGAFG
jgi:hypothetical protein